MTLSPILARLDRVRAGQSGERLDRWQYDYPPELPDEGLRMRSRRLVSGQEWRYIASRSALQEAADWCADWLAVKEAMDDYIAHGPAWLRFERRKDKPPAWAIAARSASA